MVKTIYMLPGRGPLVKWIKFHLLDVSTGSLVWSVLSEDFFREPDGLRRGENLAERKASARLIESRQEL